MHPSKKLLFALLAVVSYCASAATSAQNLSLLGGSSFSSFTTPGNYSLYQIPGDPNNVASSTIDISAFPSLTALANNSFDGRTQTFTALTYSFSVSGASNTIIPISISGLMEMAVARIGAGAHAQAEAGASIRALGQQLSYNLMVRGGIYETSLKQRVVDGTIDNYLVNYGEIGSSALSELVNFQINGFVTANQNYYVELVSSGSSIGSNSGQSAHANSSVSASIAFGAGFQDVALYSINVESGIGNGAGPGGSSVPDSVPTMLLLLVPMLGFALSKKGSKAAFAK